MNPDQFHVLQSLFDELADLPDSERHDYLQRRHDIDATTRRHLIALLDAHVQLGDATARRALNLAAFDPAHRIGTRVGAYRIERELGSGGMGSVYLARRDDGVAQEVAIKIVRTGLVDAATLARFRLERQVLALLKHPNIAAMLDLGETDDGSPYVVMEYIDGVPITTHAKALDIPGRLRLFVAICDAVAYAHRNMIVHRDIKPGNVLVDAQGHPKLLDFGIAKPLIARLGAIDIERTGTAQQFFSIYSAAPEQLRGDAITVACDVYGLGALLYELLAGRPALALEGLTPAQIEARILETEPAPPSSVVPLDRDLDAIVLRCLRKNPEQRYASVEQLADDAERYLSKRPVLARRGQWLYRAGRFAARHRLTLAAAAIVAAVVVASGALLWRQYRVAIDERVRAEAVTDFILSTIEAADPGKGGGEDVSVRQLVGQIGSRSALELVDQPTALARLTEALVAAQLSLGNADDAAKLIDGARDAIAPALARDAALAQRFRLLAARVKFGMGDDTATTKLLEEVRAHATKPAEYLQIATIEAQIPPADGQISAIREKLQQAIDRWLDDPSVDAATRWHARDALGIRLDIEGKSREALALHEQNLAEQRAAGRGTLPAIIRSLNTIAQSKSDMGDSAGYRTAIVEARTLTRSVYGTRSTPYAETLVDEGLILIDDDKAEQGVAKIEEGLKILSEILGPRHIRVGKTHFTLGGKIEALPAFQTVAEKHYELSAEIAQETLPEGHFNRLYLIGIPGAFEARIGKYDKAIQMLEPVVANATEEARQHDVYQFLDISLRFARYGANPSRDTAAALTQALDAAGESTWGQAAQDAFKVLRARIDEVRAANAAKGLAR